MKVVERRGEQEARVVPRMQRRGKHGFCPPEAYDLLGGVRLTSVSFFVGARPRREQLVRNEPVVTDFRMAPKKRVRWNHRTAPRALMRASARSFSNNVSTRGTGPRYASRLRSNEPLPKRAAMATNNSEWSRFSSRGVYLYRVCHVQGPSRPSLEY